MNTTPQNIGAPRDSRRLGDVQAALDAGQVERAIQLAAEALDAGEELPLYLNLVAHGLEERGRFPEALNLLNRAYQLAPHDPLIVNAMGLCLTMMNNYDDAIALFEAARTMDPGLPQTHFNLGDALAGRRDYDKAREAYEAAFRLKPDYADALSGLASLAARRNDFDAARTWANQALWLDPRQDVATLALAEAELAEGRPSEAKAALRKMLDDHLPKPILKARADSMLGDALSAEGRAAEAFAAYEAANAILKREHAGAYAAPGMPSVLDMANWLLGHFQGADPADWASAPPAPAPGPGEPARHIFFVGFPRSGTTLLEQVLASHPDVVALEEREVLPAVTKDLFATDEGLARLARIGPDEAAAFRQAYWRGVADWCPDLAGKTFVDKLPLTSVWLPVVSKVFPNAKVLFARRDPRDVVLSCFRRRFGMNPAMYQFLTLDGTAAYYDAVMRLSEAYARLLPTPVLAYRYEDLVEDFEREVRRICEFMGLAWNDAMLDFAATAERRPIRTPSARQVRRGLYSEGVGQWRLFAAELTPVAPLLDPWVRAFGYPET